MAKKRILNRDRVVEVAAELMDAVRRPHTISLTTLAAALDVRVPSLYNHIADLEDLHRAAGVYGLEILLVQLRDAVSEQSGVQALVTIATQYRRFALEHPGIYPLTLQYAAPDDEARLRLARDLIQLLSLIFASLGLTGDEAIHAIRGFRSVMHGFVMLETTDGFGIALDIEDSYQRLVQAYLAGLTTSQNAPLSS